MLSTLQNTGYCCGEGGCKISVHLSHVSLRLFGCISFLQSDRNPSIVLTRKHEEDSTTNLVRHVKSCEGQVVNGSKSIANYAHRVPHTTKPSFDTSFHAGCLSAIGRSWLSTIHHSSLSSKCCMQRSKLHHQQRFRGILKRFMRSRKAMLERSFKFVSQHVSSSYTDPMHMPYT